MREFTRLYQELDSTTSTNERVQTLVEYFHRAAPEDAAWATWFLSGNRPRRVIRMGLLQQWCAEQAGMPDWLFEACREFTGDLAETIALLLPDPEQTHDEGLAEWVEDRLLPLAAEQDSVRKVQILAAWNQLTQPERLVFNKLLTGGFRVGVSGKLVIRSLSQFSGVPAEVIAHRLMGKWQPSAERFLALFSEDTSDTDLSRPYPFCLAHPLPADTMEALQQGPESESVTDDVSGEESLASAAESSAAASVALIPAAEMLELFAAPARLGQLRDWMLEWKWDGIRAQLILRAGQVFLWSRGEELMTERFPELEQFARRLPDGTVLDGEVIAVRDGSILPFTELQRRVQRRKVGLRLQQEVPVQFVVFDLLEVAGADIRQRPMAVRRELLEGLLQEAGAGPAERFVIAERLQPTNWQECARLRDSSRERRVEGLMLKRCDAEYSAGRVTGVWWKWKADPWNCDAVLLYAQRGHGRRGGRFTDFTFGVRDGDDLVPIARAYTGLTKSELEEVDQFVRQNTLRRFGPVVSVTAELVFELAFEGLQVSDRHRSGLAVRFPRIVRWRRDKRVADIDTLQSLQSLAASAEQMNGRAEISAAGESRAAADQGGGQRGRRQRRQKRASGDQPLGGLFAGMED